MAPAVAPAGRVFVAGDDVEVHHRVPQCLLRLYDAANGEDAWGVDGDGIQKWLDFEHECMRWGVDVDITREELAALVDSSTTPLSREDHRREHEGDFVRWGRRGGLATLRRYGSEWFGLLGKRRWGRITPADLVPVSNATDR